MGLIDGCQNLFDESHINPIFKDLLIKISEHCYKIESQFIDEHSLWYLNIINNFLLDHSQLQYLKNTFFLSQVK